VVVTWEIAVKVQVTQVNGTATYEETVRGAEARDVVVCEPRF
jgi:hypothetical protein